MPNKNKKKEVTLNRNIIETINEYTKVFICMGFIRDRI